MRKRSREPNILVQRGWKRLPRFRVSGRSTEAVLELDDEDAGCFCCLGILGFGVLASTDAEAQYLRYGGYYGSGYGGYYGGYGGYYGGYYNRPVYYYAPPRRRVVVTRVVTYPAYSPYYGGGYYRRGHYGW